MEKWAAIGIIGMFFSMAIPQCVSYASSAYCVSHAATVEIARECRK